MIYRLRYCNKDGVEARVDIQKGLATPVIDVEGTERPFILSYNNDKGNKSGMFLSSSADIEIYETPDFNINNLKTSNETELSVTHYINNVISWQGFVIPDFFSIEVRSNPVIAMTASDRIGTLKSVTLSNLPSMITNRELCVQCLEKTGLNLPLKTLADFHNGVDDFYNSKVFSQRLTGLKGRSISCYDILGSILTQTNSKLLQRDGAWHIINKYQHELGSGKLYSSATSSTDWTDSIHNFNELTKGARRLIVPVASSVGVYHEHGGGKTYPENSDFSKGLSGWTTYNDFDCEINNNEVLRYIQDLTYWWPSLGGATEKNNLRCNRNPFNPNASNNPYVESPPIVVTYPNSNSVEVTIDINAISTGAFIAATSYINFAVIAKAPDNSLYSLGGSGSFTSFSGNPYFHRERVMAEASGAATTVFKGVKGVLTIDDDNLEGYNFYVRIYGSGGAFTPFINSVSASFMQPSDNPKGLIYKTEQGVNFTKTHEIETSIFGDFMTGGLNGYFYPYPTDDTSSLYNSNNELTSKWSAPNDNEELPLLQHAVRQKARMFSVAHDVLRGELEISNFDPLFIFKDCNNTRYSLISGKFDFLNSSAEVEIEEIKYLNINRRDFIYSYFGDGESGIKSIGGISGGTGGGGSGGGMTPEQIEILSFWKKDPDNPNTIFTEMNAYSKLEISAYGAGSGGGGGGGSTVEWGTLTNGYRQLTVEGVTYSLAQNTHKHLWADITDKPSTFTPSAHTHSAGDITSGTFAIARIPTGTTSGTVAEGNDSRIINGQTAFGWGNHSGLYLPLTGGTMANTNLVTNLNADLLDGEDSSFFKKRYNVIIKKGTWSRILYATPIALSGSFIVSINYTRNSTVVGNVFLITFGHSGHGQITVLGTHGYTQIQARLTGDANNIYLELFDEGYGTVGDTQTATITLDSINANITTYTSFTDGTTLSGSVKSLVSTVNNRINVDGRTVAFIDDDITGNAATATTLATARTIAGVSFDGTANIAIPFANLSSKPTTLGGYGITDAMYENNNRGGHDLNTLKTQGFYALSGNPLNAPAGSGYSNILVVQSSSDRFAQMNFQMSYNEIYYRNGTGGTTTWGSWRQIAFRDSNVASATKLQTARTIAGVSFDGTANIAIPFANLSSKPTTLGGYGITDAVTLNTAQTITGAKTFDANIILGVNRYIQGTDNYTGVWNVDNKLWRFGSSSTGSVSNIRSEKVGIGTDTPTQKLHVVGNILATGATTTTKVIFNAAGWSMEQVGSELQMKHNNVLKMRFTSTGSIIATEEITAFA
mgnify:CR=1 FL=1